MHADTFTQQAPQKKQSKTQQAQKGKQKTIGKLSPWCQTPKKQSKQSKKAPKGLISV
jgi:hypothetical protein